MTPDELNKQLRKAAAERAAGRKPARVTQEQLAARHTQSEVTIKHTLPPMRGLGGFQGNGVQPSGREPSTNWDGTFKGL
jgi:hypothetical protein